MAYDSVVSLKSDLDHFQYNRGDKSNLPVIIIRRNMNVPHTNIPTPYSQQFREYLGNRIHYRSLVWIFFIINLLNYVERSIIPGSVVEIEEFVSRIIGHDPATYVGMLQSAFILGFSVACVVFGFFVSLQSPFSVICIGLGVWTIATIMSGCAWNYVSLFIARLFSGVGEAAFQIVVPAFIDDYSPKDLVGTSMSILYMAIPVGTAIGYTLAGYIAEHYSWRIMYMITAPLMVPFMIILLFYPIDSVSEGLETSSPLCVSNDNGEKEEEVVSLEKEKESMDQVDESEVKENPETRSWVVLKGIGTMMITPTFLLAVIGEAGCVFISSGFTSFGNVFLMNLHLFPTESVSALVVGCTGCLAGIIGLSIISN